MIVAVMLVAYSSGDQLDRITVTLTVINRAVAIVQCGLLVLVVLLARFLNFSWTSYAFGIALGMGFFASTQLVLSALRAHYGAAFPRTLFDEISMAAYHCCVLFWVVALWLPKREASVARSTPVDELEHWNNVLQRLLHQ